MTLSTNTKLFFSMMADGIGLSLNFQLNSYGKNVTASSKCSALWSTSLDLTLLALKQQVNFSRQFILFSHEIESSALPTWTYTGAWDSELTSRGSLKSLSVPNLLKLSTTHSVPSLQRNKLLCSRLTDMSVILMSAIWPRPTFIRFLWS